MLRQMTFYAMLLFACAPLFAQSASTLEVGDLAPELHVTYWFNTPEMTTLGEMRGDVVLIKAWGIS